MVKSSSARAGVPGDRGSRIRPIGRFLLLAVLILLPISILACFSTRPKDRAVPPVPPVAITAPEDQAPAAVAVPALPAGAATAAIAELTDPTVPGRCTSEAGVCADARPAVPAPATARPAAPQPQALSRPTAAVFRQVQGLSPQILTMALDAVTCARALGVAGKDDLLTLIDYSRPSTEPRLWVLDLAHGKVLFHELVAHGAGSGDNYATRFSNLDDSRQTSLGLFLTRDTYEGGNGYSLKLQGLDAGVNDRALERKIVMHGAWYVSPDQIQRYGRLGRSWGCPALSVGSAHRVIDTIKGGSFVFSYSAADGGWMKASSRSRRCTPPQAPSTPAATPLALTAAAIAGR
jgi:hypothetical protein